MKNKDIARSVSTCIITFLGCFILLNNYLKSSVSEKSQVGSKDKSEMPFLSRTCFTLDGFIRGFTPASFNEMWVGKIRWTFPLLFSCWIDFWIFQALINTLSLQGGRYGKAHLSNIQSLVSKLNQTGYYLTQLLYIFILVLSPFRGTEWQSKFTPC